MLSAASFAIGSVPAPLRDKDAKTSKALTSLEKTTDPEVRACLIGLVKPTDKAKDPSDKKMLACGTILEGEQPSGTQPFIPSGIWATGAPMMWPQAITGKTSLIAVIDTGIDKDHPDLKDKVVIQRDFVNDGKPVSSWNPHGTHVAGTIAANGKILGVAPHARLADYRVLNSEGSGSFHAITRAIYQATLDGCNIINLSLGGPVDYRPMHAAIQNAVANGVLVVAAVGNEGDANPATSEISYPGYYHEVCGAGAVQFSTSADEPKTVLDAYFTNTNKEVDVAAPGYQVWSTIPGGGYAAYNGTSMAAPHVSGFAALLYDKFKMRTQDVLPPGVLFSMVKTMTVDINDLGLDDTTGAGFITFHTEIPKKRNGQWVFEEFRAGMPDILKLGTVPPIRASGKRTSGPYEGKKKDLFGQQVLTR
jgi:major intracellular serine protease